MFHITKAGTDTLEEESEHFVRQVSIVCADVRPFFLAVRAILKVQKSTYVPISNAFPISNTVNLRCLKFDAYLGECRNLRFQRSEVDVELKNIATIYQIKSANARTWLLQTTSRSLLSLSMVDRERPRDEMEKSRTTGK